MRAPGVCPTGADPLRITRRGASRSACARGHTLQSVTAIQKSSTIGFHRGGQPSQGCGKGIRGADCVVRAMRFGYESPCLKFEQVPAKRPFRNAGMGAQVLSGSGMGTKCAIDFTPPRMREGRGQPIDQRDRIRVMLEALPQSCHQGGGLRDGLVSDRRVLHRAARTPHPEQAARIQCPEVLTGNGNRPSQSLCQAADRLVRIPHQGPIEMQTFDIGQHAAGAPERRLEFRCYGHGHTLQSVTVARQPGCCFPKALRYGLAGHASARVLRRQRCSPADSPFGL
jgi:hypothetical protein